MDDFELKIKELSRNYDIGLELIGKTHNNQELLDAILDEYLLRLSEIPAIDLNELYQQHEIDFKKEKLKSLIMFATQAVVLKEKAELYKKLDAKNYELELKNEHYLNMLSFVSHELRNPLISVLGYSELLSNNILGKLNDEQNDAINVIVRVSKNLIDMIKNYLDLTKIETGQMKIKMKRSVFNLSEQLIKSIIIELNEQFTQKQMTAVPVQEIPDIKLNADEELLKIVIKNLFNNAIKYGKRGTEINYRLKEDKKSLLFSVRNSGIGVKEKDLQKIFDKFTQIFELRPPDVHRGSGLGLFIVKTIIEEHGGKVWAESKYGEWFQVFFTIPKDGSPQATFLNSANKNLNTT